MNKFKLHFPSTLQVKLKLKTIIHTAGLISVILFTTSVLSAQEYRIPSSAADERRLILKDFTGDLQVEGYEGDEIVFFRTAPDSDQDLSDAKPGEKENMTSSDKSDNSGIGLQIEKDDNQIRVTCLQVGNRAGEYKIKVPDSYALGIKGHCERTKDITVSGMRNEVEIKNCQSVKLVNASGSLIVSVISGNITLENCAPDKDAVISLASISGNIRAELIRLISGEPIRINSISGNVALALPEKITAGYQIKTISGVVKSDFEFPAGSKNQVVGTKIDYPGNGDAEIIINTVSGNISLRKAD